MLAECIKRSKTKNIISHIYKLQHVESGPLREMSTIYRVTACNKPY